MASHRALLARIALAARPLGLIGLLAVPGLCVAVPCWMKPQREDLRASRCTARTSSTPTRFHTRSDSDADVRPPRELAPAFFGCYDWHSSVHGHWLLARLARQFPQAPFAVDARAALAQSLTPAHIAGEVAYFQTPGRASYERPYGLAWLLMLAAELRTWDDPQAKEWTQTLAPLEAEAAQRLRSWLPKLRYPIRVGEHSQTAFAFGLVHDWARVTGRRRDAVADRIEGARILCGGHQLPAELRAVGRRLPFALPCRGRPDAAHPAAARIRRRGCAISCRSSRRTRRRPGSRPAK